LGIKKIKNRDAKIGKSLPIRTKVLSLFVPNKTVSDKKMINKTEKK
jgi:hypothetical protein